MNDELEKLIEIAGSRAELAKQLSVTAGALSQWETAGGMPPARAIESERMTNGEVKAIHLVVQPRVMPPIHNHSPLVCDGNYS